MCSHLESQERCSNGKLSGYISALMLALPEDLENLVNLRITREKGLSCAHLGENTPNRPHINAGGVLPTTK